MYICPIQYKYMVLTDKALKSITPKTRIKLAAALGCTEQWIIKSMVSNKPNGILTKFSALQIIREEGKLSDSDLLEEQEESLMG